MRKSASLSEPLSAAVKQRARRLDRHAAADAVFAAGPAGIDQPAIDLVLVDVVAQQIGIDRRVARQERRAEAGREFRLHADQTLSRCRRPWRCSPRGNDTSPDSAVSLAIGGITPIGVGGEEDDVLGMAGAAGARGIRNEIERIGRARVLGLGGVVVIGNARHRIESDVFQHGAETVGGVPDLGLGLARELDGLGVAAALEIEDAVRAPAVLIVADQRAVRIGRQRGLAGAGQAEEQRASRRPGRHWPSSASARRSAPADRS